MLEGLGERVQSMPPIKHELHPQPSSRSIISQPLRMAGVEHKDRPNIVGLGQRLASDGNVIAIHETNGALYQIVVGLISNRCPESRHMEPGVPRHERWTAGLGPVYSYTEMS